MKTYIEKEIEKQNTLVAYHNDFNKVIIPKLSITEQNILLGMFSVLKDVGIKDIILTPSDLRKFTGKNYTTTELQKIVRSLRDNFFKIDFTILVTTEKYDINVTINLFRTFSIYTLKNTQELEKVELKVNEDFAYILNSLVANFTSFELAEFLPLKNKYAKILYRVLKQYKNTGRCCVYKYKWGEFANTLHITNKYTQCDVNEKVLNPVIKELSGIFKNLRYEKIKEKGSRGQGGKVIGIEFYFDVIDTKNCIDVV